MAGACLVAGLAGVSAARRPAVAARADAHRRGWLPGRTRPRRRRGDLLRSATRPAVELRPASTGTPSPWARRSCPRTAGGEMTISDGSGAAHESTFAASVIFIRGDDYHEMVGPDWALHLETALVRGIACMWRGPSRWPRSATPAALTAGGISPLFAGPARRARRGDHPRARRPSVRLALRCGIAWSPLAASGALSFARLDRAGRLRADAVANRSGHLPGTGDGPEVGAGGGDESAPSWTCTSTTTGRPRARRWCGRPAPDWCASPRRPRNREPAPRARACSPGRPRRSSPCLRLTGHSAPSFTGF